MKYHLFYIYSTKGELYSKYYSASCPKMKEGETRSFEPSPDLELVTTGVSGPYIEKYMGEFSGVEIDHLMGKFAS